MMSFCCELMRILNRLSSIGKNSPMVIGDSCLELISRKSAEAQVFCLKQELIDPTLLCFGYATRRLRFSKILKWHSLEMSLSADH